MSDLNDNEAGRSKRNVRLKLIIATVIIASIAGCIYILHKTSVTNKEVTLICPLPAGLKLDNAHYSDSLLTADGSRCAVIVESNSKYYLLSDTGSVSVYNPALAAEATRAAAAATQPSTTRQYEIEDLSTSQPTTEPQSQPETSEKYNRTYDVGEEAAKIGKGPHFDFLSEPSIGASMDTAFTPDGKHLLTITTQSDEKSAMFLDGKEIAKYDSIQSWWFNPQSQLEYIARDGEKSFLVTAAGKSEEYDSIEEFDDTSCHDRPHAVFLCHKNKDEKYLIVNGTKIGPYKNFLAWRIDSKGDHFACVAQDANGQMRVIVDGTTGKVYDEIENLTLSPSGGAVAFKARCDDQLFAVINGKETKPWKQIEGIAPNQDDEEKSGCINVSDITFSQDGKRLAMRIRIDSEYFAWVDGTVGPACGQIRDLMFSPNAKHFAYCANGQCVIVDGVPKTSYIAVGNITFSPNSERLAYKACETNENNGDVNEFIVCDDNEGQPFNNVSLPSFDKNNSLVYIAGDQKTVDCKKFAIIVENWQGPWEDKIRPINTQLNEPTAITCSYYTDSGLGIFGAESTSPFDIQASQYSLEAKNARRVVYATGGDYYVPCSWWPDGDPINIVIDGWHGPAYSVIKYFTLSPDGKRYAYSASRVSSGPRFDPSKTNDRFEQKYFVNIDGRELPVTGPAGGFAFSADGAHIAYRVEDEQSHMQHIVLDETPLTSYRWVSRPVFRADGVMIYYAINDAGLHRITKTF